MKKLYIVKHPYEFESIIKTGTRKKNDSIILYIKESKYSYPRYGISVGKKLGNAVFRNKKKRQMRSIIDNLEKDYIKNKDYIIILREKGKNLEYQTLNEKIKSLIYEGKDQK